MKWRRERAGIIPFAGAFNLDDLRAKIAEQHGAVRPRKHSREVKYADAFQRSHGLLSRKRGS